MNAKLVFVFLGVVACSISGIYGIENTSAGETTVPNNTSSDDKTTISSSTTTAAPVKSTPVPASIPKSNVTDVSIYYDTYSQGSIDFITKQFYPLYISDNKTELAKYFNFVFVPYGGQEIKSVDAVTCKNGEKACVGDRIHACVLNIAEATQDEKFKFIACTLQNTNIQSNDVNYTAKDKCFTATLKAEDLTTCNNETGNGYLLQFYNTKVQGKGIEDVPAIIFGDGAFSKEVSASAEKDFKKEVCSRLSDPKPDICKNSATFVSATLLQVIAAALFVYVKFY